MNAHRLAPLQQPQRVYLNIDGQQVTLTCGLDGTWSARDSHGDLFTGMVGSRQQAVARATRAASYLKHFNPTT